MQPESRNESLLKLSCQTVHNCHDMVQSFFFFFFPGYLVGGFNFTVFSFLSFLLILHLYVFEGMSEGILKVFKTMTTLCLP